MEILIFNSWWMLWNAFLAALPVVFVFGYLKANRILLKVIMAICWLLFLPNSLYVISDMEHLVTQWRLFGDIELPIAIIQYVHLQFIGLTAFLFCMYAFERELRRLLKRPHPKVIAVVLITLNFVIGFAMVVGKVERVNSWDVFSSTEAVFFAFRNILQNDNLVLLAILFGLFGNFFYFLLRDPMVKYARRVAKAERLTKRR